MLLATSEKGKPKGRTRFAGIGEFAHREGLDRTHVYRVLSGQRKSARLIARWKDFLKAA